MPDKDYVYDGNELGLVLGGASGVNNNYIDVLIFDENEFFEKCKSWGKENNIKMHYSDFKQESSLVELF